RDLKEKLSAEIVPITDSPEAFDWAPNRMLLPAGLPEWLAPIISIVPGQLLAYHLTMAKGFDPDRPRTIHKVTETK
ncbi:MAG TPA: glucosamine--fructose-6-phosphate aminotransferase, partial [Anaerolineaceae bacterium]|nr:glucosamine--fructose-6-phosphate aminotransferase [Anaerolineaceae bacterium]